MQLTPYLIFNGQCEEALKFYAKTMGGNIQGLSRYKDAPGENRMGMDGEKVMHSHLEVDGNMLFMASDGPGGSGDSGMAFLSLNFTDAGRIQNVFAALGDGGTVIMPLQDTFWGATFGMLKDQYGVKWMFNYDKPKG